MLMPLWLFLVSSFAVAVITGLANPSHGGLLTQVIQCLLGILSLATIVAGFCSYGWKIGLLKRNPKKDVSYQLAQASAYSETAIGDRETHDTIKIVRREAKAQE